jgi:Ca2+-binding RTX toxin-like protein
LGAATTTISTWTWGRASSSSSLRTVSRVGKGIGVLTILDGGAGNDILSGGDGSTILLGGPTAHDNEVAALLQILAEWTSTDCYRTRIDKLRNGTDGLPKFDATTVFDDGAVDILHGNQGLDWFFAGLDDQLPDRFSAEQVN